ncbi:MAG TPA: M23 family metallopeptidase [Gemmatimonadaceae bacterium]|nr:M23 family metallopeptidase [Gemmatimonadaceae bacterium]
MSEGQSEQSAGRGYGNIYTPHAGAMIIHVQRESGLANRTIVLTQRQVRLLRGGGVIAGAVLFVGVLSWVFLATQAARVPLLSQRVESLQNDVRRIDTLQRALNELEGRYEQVQRMMGATSTGAATGATSSAGGTAGARAAAESTATDTLAFAPREWPLPIAGTLLVDTLSGGSAGSHGMDIGVPPRTPIHASGAGVVIELRTDSTAGMVIRIAHRSGYQSIYANATDVRVQRGQHVAAGTVIGLTGDSTQALPPHLHFEVLHHGVDVDPASLMTKGPAHGDLQ